jgi:phosphoserine phosphatase
MQIVLLRHGATDWNLLGRCQGSSDLDLNAFGVGQARQTAILLSREPIHACYSSHLKRARQTAALVSEPHGLPVGIEENVRELDHGTLEGLTFTEIKQKYPEFIARWRTEPAEIQVPGGERLSDVARRAWDGLTRIVDRNERHATVAVVSHNIPILSIICRITGVHLNQYRSFHLDPASITRLTYDGGDKWTVIQINNQAYVAGDTHSALERP